MTVFQTRAPQHETRHILDFTLPILASTARDQRNPDKQRLRETILALHALGMSCRNGNHRAQLMDQPI